MGDGGQLTVCVVSLEERVFSIDYTIRCMPFHRLAGQMQHLGDGGQLTARVVSLEERVFHRLHY